MAAAGTRKDTGSQAHPPADPAGPTGRLATWVAETTLDDVPASVRDRAKHLVLDGIACALVGAQLPVSRIGVEGVTALDSAGDSPADRLGRSGHQRHFGGHVELQLHPGFRARRLPPAGAAAQQLDHPSGDARRRSARRPRLRRAVPPRRHPRLRDWPASRPGARRPGHALPRMAFGCGLRPHRRGRRRGNALWTGRRRVRGRLRDRGDPVLRAHVGDVRIDGQAHAARLRLAQRPDRAPRSRRSGYVGIKRVFERPYGGWLAVFGEGHRTYPEAIYAGLGHPLGDRADRRQGVLGHGTAARRDRRRARASAKGRRQPDPADRHRHGRSRLRTWRMEGGAPARGDRRPDERRLCRRGGPPRRRRARRPVHPGPDQQR